MCVFSSAQRIKKKSKKRQTNHAESSEQLFPFNQIFTNKKRYFNQLKWQLRSFDWTAIKKNKTKQIIKQSIPIPFIIFKNISFF